MGADLIRQQPGCPKPPAENVVLKNSSGAALLMVLWVLTLLTVISGEFCRAMRTETNISRNYRDVTQAYYAAVGGMNTAIYQILRDIAPPKTLTKTNEPGEDGRIPWRINTAPPQLVFGHGSATVRIDNESGKVNLNLADEGLLRLWISGLDIGETEKNTIIDAILDWRDGDDLHRLNGAENDFYQSLPEPYPCKNGDFESVAELMRVKGVTPEIFHGGLSRMATVYPGRKFLQEKEGWTDGQKRPEGQFDYNRININAASPELVGMLPGFSEEAVDSIVAYRQEKDFRTNAELLEIIDPKEFAGVSNFLTYSLSPYYRVQALGTVADSEAHRMVGALIDVDLKSDETYRIVQWIDHVRPDDPEWKRIRRNENDS